MYRRGNIVECVRDFNWNGEAIVKKGSIHHLFMARTLCHGQLLDIGLIRNEPVIHWCSCGRSYKDQGVILIPSEFFKKVDDTLLKQIGKLEHGFRKLLPLEEHS